MEQSEFHQGLFERGSETLEKARDEGREGPTEAIGGESHLSSKTDRGAKPQWVCERRPENQATSQWIPTHHPGTEIQIIVDGVTDRSDREPGDGEAIGQASSDSALHVHPLDAMLSGRGASGLLAGQGDRRGQCDAEAPGLSGGFLHRASGDGESRGVGTKLITLRCANSLRDTDVARLEIRAGGPCPPDAEDGLWVKVCMTDNQGVAAGHPSDTRRNRRHMPLRESPLLHRPSANL
jgi:hypothetical protein